MTECSSASPCIGICSLDDDDICVGCYRSIGEITAWPGLDDEARCQIVQRARERAVPL